MLRSACTGPASSRLGAGGMGGHAAVFLERLPGLTLVGLDRDLDALAIAEERLKGFGERVKLVHTVYDGIAGALADLKIDAAQGILFDLGVSSLQLDRVDRGFSYSQDAPLDMRMNAGEGGAELTAAIIVATYREGDLRRIFESYGEEKLSARYARAIIAAREQEPITTSARLVEILSAATPAAVQRAGHPAKRVFQALRIEVNQELTVLADAIPAALATLAVDGRMVVLAYQSLEDRIVKRALQAGARSTAPAGLPMELPEHKPELELLVRGAELATPDEIEENPRAKPVRLRAVRRLRSVT